MLNDLRGRATVQTDGQIRTGRDIAIACMLGGGGPAEGFYNHSSDCYGLYYGEKMSSYVLYYLLFSKLMGK